MAISSISKNLLGTDDTNWDLEGLNSGFSQKTSKGKTRSNKLVNAADVPVTTTVRGKKFSDQVPASTKGITDVDATLAQIMDHLTLTGLPNTTSYFAISVAGDLTIKALAITSAELAALAVTTAKIVDGAVTAVKLADGTITGGKIADDAIDSQHYAATSIDNEHLAVDTVGIDELNLDNAGGTLGVFSVSGVRHVCTGGAATETITGLVGLLAGDIYLASFNVNVGARTITTIEYASATTALVTASGAITANDVISVTVLRPTIAVA